MLGKRQRGERARIQQGLEKGCQLCQTMPKKPTGKDSAEMLAARLLPLGKPPEGDAWERPARSCGSAPAQGTLHMPRADVRAGMLQGQSQSGKGRRSRRKGLRGPELSRCESTAGEGTQSSPRTATAGPELFSRSWAGTGTPHASKSKLGFPLALPIISVEHRLFIRSPFPIQSTLNSVNRDQV